MSNISNNYIIEKLQNKFVDTILYYSEPAEILTITIPGNINVEIVSWLANDPELQFTFLTDLTGIHFPDNKDAEIGVIYHLHSFVNNIRIRIKLYLESANPFVQSLTPVFKSANWMERETYDFYGIIFLGHPNLKRILNMDEMDYFPMLKQYPLEDQQREDKEDKFFGR